MSLLGSPGRGMTVSVHMGAMEDRLIQPIVLLVDKNDPAHHLDAIVTVARASVLTYARDLHQGLVSTWEPWLAQSFGKTVRRAKSSAFTKASNLPCGEYVSSYSTRAIAFAPMSYANMPKELSVLQVAGTDLLRHGLTPTTQFQIVLNAGLAMSTGKSAAQAAHALFGWFLTLDATAQERQVSRGLQVSAIEVSAAEFSALSRNAAAPVIVDSGFTEIPPNTPTAFILRSKP